MPNAVLDARRTCHIPAACILAGLLHTVLRHRAAIRPGPSKRDSLRGFVVLRGYVRQVSAAVSLGDATKVNRVLNRPFDVCEASLKYRRRGIKNVSKVIL